MIKELLGIESTHIAFSARERDSSVVKVLTMSTQSSEFDPKHCTILVW